MQILEDIKNGKSGNVVRIYGYNNEILKFLSDFYLIAKKNGKYITENLKNPSEDEVSEFLSYAGANISYSKAEIIGFFPYLDKKEKVAEKLENFINTTNFGSESIKKNTYVKLMCWLRFQFLNVARQAKPCVLFEGKATKYENYFFDLLGAIGANVVVCDFFNQNATKSSENDIICDRFGAPLVHFVNIASEVKKEPITQQAKSSESINNQVKSYQNTQKTPQNAMQDLDKVYERDFAISNANVNKDNIFSAVFNKTSDKNNVYCYLSGATNLENYPNELYDFYSHINSSQKPFIIVEDSIANPSVQEAEKFKQYTDLSDFNVNFLNKIELNVLARKAVLAVISKEPQVKQKNLMVCMLAWLLRYKELFFKKDGIFILFNGYKYSDLVFLKVLKRLGIDVFLINPNKMTSLDFIDNELLNISYDDSLELQKFPKTKQAIIARTVASNAESQLDTILYNSDVGIFRDRQFVNSSQITLKTTYDEIAILWTVEAKYRPYFEVNDNVVVTPNIFAKVLGIDQGNKQKYIQNIKNLNINNAIFYNSFGFCKLNLQSPFLHKAHNFYNNGKLQKDIIKADKDYKYAYLNYDTAEYILEKIEYFLTLDWILADKSKFYKIALSVLLDIDREILVLLQKFDFTKQIPKVIVLHFDETLATLEDVILLSFLHILGFDVVIFAPNGYSDVENHLKKGVFNQYKVGDYDFDMSLEAFYKNESIINKLFGKGF